MIRFSAVEPEIEAMLRFLARRTPGGLRMTPLAGRNRDDLRFRRTPRPLMKRLVGDDAATQWGLRPATDADAPVVKKRDPASGLLIVDPEASRLILLQLGAAQGPERRRDGLLEARDWTDTSAEAPVTAPQALFARALLERCARRLRRHGCQKNGRWFQGG